MVNRRVPPARTIPVARLVDGEVRSLVGSHVAPQRQARDELVALWDQLSPQGRKALLTAARLTAKEEGLLPEGQGVIAQDGEVS
ncbi:hypothetical protein HMPREF9946_02180 [Acetobacteraceae bacterium AT-5844]|nr:hypothetical protein HMPREF9946_02180 [Acetobacteraceae bacterium AT-5844]